MEHRIIQYSLEGEFIKVWDNTNQAAESGADSQALIRKDLKGEPTRKELKYQWRYYTNGYPQHIGPKIICGNKEEWVRSNDTIEELDWKGNVVATYSGTGEAAEKSGMSQSYICNILAGKIRHPKRRFRRMPA